MAKGTKTKIVLDADVIIHFAKGGWLHLLPRFLPDYQFAVLDVVKQEIPALLLPMLVKVDSINEIVFGGTEGELREFARLTSPAGLALGRGESACMVYCRYHHDVVGSSNIRDVTAYCEEFGITYLTTNDFLFYGIKHGVITKASAADFITDVREKGSYPPVVDFETYFCDKL